MHRLRAGVLSAFVILLGCGAVSPVRVVVRPDSVLANGYDTAELSVESGNSRPVVSIVDNHSAVVKTIEQRNEEWLVTVRARGLNLCRLGRPAVLCLHRVRDISNRHSVD